MSYIFIIFYSSWLLSFLLLSLSPHILNQRNGLTHGVLRKISARQVPNLAPSQSPLDPDSTSSPKVRQLYNIFHPSDPISYRIEPLVSPAMSALKPQILPYTKKGMFANVAPQGLSSIGVKVGQSVSGLWSSLSAGIASSLLNRSLGLSSEEVARMNAEVSSAQGLGERADGRKREVANASAEHGTTLIDDDLETLYAKFQKTHRHLEASGSGADDQLDDEKREAQKMWTEDARVRALNMNGRIDYSIQE